MRNFDLAGGRRALQYAASVSIVLGSVLNAQTVIGTWQGALPIPEKPRRIIKIDRNDNGSLRGVMYRIDYDASSIPVTVSFQAPEVKVVQDILNNSFQGKLSADGKSITGTWTQDKQAYPLTLVLTAPDSVWKFAGAIPIPPMAATADPAFEVATIKPSLPDVPQRATMRIRHFTVTSYTVDDMITFAWKLRMRQIDSTPSKAEWINESKFDIAAEPDIAGQPSMDQQRLMLKKLLADRFQLKFHMVQKIFPVYALTVEKDLGRLVKSDPSVNSLAGRIFTKEMPDGQMRLQFSYMTMQEFLNILMNFIPDRQIVDETQLAGEFDFTIEVPMSLFQGEPPSDDERINIFFRAVQDLGFKLVPKKEPLDVIVIDHLEKPSAN